MHEFSTATLIVESVLRAVKAHDAHIVKEVKIILGKLSLLNPDQIRFSYYLLSEGTILESSKLIIEIRAAKIKCESCQYEGQIDSPEDDPYHLFLRILKCPKCGATPKIIEGKECMLESVKMMK